MPPPAHVSTLRSRDLDELADGAARLGCPLERRQLSSSSASGEVRFTLGEEVGCIVEAIPVSFHNLTATPDHLAVFGVVVRAEHRPRFQGRAQDRGMIRVARPGAEFDVVSRGPAAAAHVALKRSFFDGFCHRARVGQPSYDVPLIERPDLAARLRRIVGEVLRGVLPTEVAADALASVLSETCGSAREADASAGPSFRHVGLARDYVEGHLGEAIRLADLCRHAGVGLRTLQRAFREHFGLSPLQYVERRRMHAARRLLRAQGSGVLTVAAVAQRVGEVHPGRFSARYRRLFGELPRETLRLARGEALTRR